MLYRPIAPATTSSASGRGPFRLLATECFASVITALVVASCPVKPSKHSITSACEGSFASKYATTSVQQPSLHERQFRCRSAFLQASVVARLGSLSPPLIWPVRARTGRSARPRRRISRATCETVFPSASALFSRASRNDSSIRMASLALMDTVYDTFYVTTTRTSGAPI